MLSEYRHRIVAKSALLNSGHRQRLVIVGWQRRMMGALVCPVLPVEAGFAVELARPVVDVLVAVVPAWVAVVLTGPALGAAAQVAEQAGAGQG